MKLSEWRPALTTWLDTYLVIDSLLLERPEIGKSNGLLPPLRQVTYRTDSPSYITASGVQDFLLTKRFPDGLAYKDLPLGAIEGIHQTLAMRLLKDFRSIHADIIDLDMVKVETPVALSEVGDKIGEWLVELTWSFELSWYAEAEIPIYAPQAIDRISLGLWRENLAGASSTLDQLLVINQP